MEAIGDHPGAARPAGHPLDPLTARSSGGRPALRRDRGVGPGANRLDRAAGAPQGHSGRAGEPGAPPCHPAREALAVCWDRDNGHAYRAVVSLESGTVPSWEPLPGQQPNITLDEWHECDDMLRGDPRLAAALARAASRRSRILTDLWASARTWSRHATRARLGWADVWYRGSEQGNPYAHHLSGLHPIVDLNRMALLEIEDDGGPRPPGCPR